MKSQTNEEIKLELINRILNLYNELITLDTELIDFLKNNFRLLELSDGDVLLERNMYATDFYFVGYGLLVGESIINGHKVINWFCGPNDSCTSISGMYGDFESKEKIYSHGRTFCLALDNTSIQLGYEKFPALNTLLRKMFEYYLKSSQQRADIIRLGTAKQRY